MTETVLVTYLAGFIGYHTSKRLLADGFNVVKLDALDDYVDVLLEEARLAHERFVPIIGPVKTRGLIMMLLKSHNQ